MTPTGSYWANTDKPRRQRPPPASPAFLARVRLLKERFANADASESGLLCCPDCGRTKGVGLTLLHRAFRSSHRHYAAHCPCGRYGPPKYGREAARKAWNALDRSHLQLVDVNASTHI